MMKQAKKVCVLALLGAVLSACPREVEEPQYEPAIEGWEDVEPRDVVAYPSGGRQNGEASDGND